MGQEEITATAVSVSAEIDDPKKGANEFLLKFTTYDDSRVVTLRKELAEETRSLLPRVLENCGEQDQEV